MMLRHAQSWQLILADLALILFLVTLSALASEESSSSVSPPAPDPEFAPAQALFRPVNGGPTIAQWLAERPRDPRASLTIYARHRPGRREAIWQRVDELAREAEESGFAVRIVVSRGETSDLYASLGYDQQFGGT